MYSCCPLQGNCYWRSCFLGHLIYELYMLILVFDIKFQWGHQLNTDAILERFFFPKKNKKPHIATKIDKELTMNILYWLECLFPLFNIIQTVQCFICSHAPFAVKIVLACLQAHSTPCCGYKTQIYWLNPIVIRVSVSTFWPVCKISQKPFNETFNYFQYPFLWHSHEIIRFFQPLMKLKGHFGVYWIRSMLENLRL